MRHALQRLCRWIGRFCVSFPSSPSRAPVSLCLESLEERLALSSLPAPSQTFLAWPPVATISLTPAPVASPVQGVTFFDASNPGQTNSYMVMTVSAAEGAGNFSPNTVFDATQAKYGQSSGLTIQVISQPAVEVGPGAGSSPRQPFQPPDAGPGSTIRGQQPSPADLAIPLSVVPSAGAPPDASPALIAPSVAATPLNPALDLQSVGFRISRTPADASRLQVTFVQIAYGPADSVVEEGAATFVPGAAHIDIPLAGAQEQSTKPREIVTLTLLDAGDYRVAQPTATLFLGGPARGCSETALFEAYRLGQSTEAFNALFQLHRSSVFQTCYGLLGNRADAEDVSQIVFMMFARQSLRLGTNVAGWLHTVARNACIGLWRSRSRRLRHEKKAAKAERVQGDDETTELRDELEAALAQLAPDLRTAVRLRYLEGWSQQQAALWLGCPRGTLSQRAARGIQTLRDILGGTAE
jgi:RNA polymerase sigma-70 factor (ECF subfamily)